MIPWQGNPDVQFMEAVHYSMPAKDHLLTFGSSKPASHVSHIASRRRLGDMRDQLDIDFAVVALERKTLPDPRHELGSGFNARRRGNMACRQQRSKLQRRARHQHVRPSQAHPASRRSRSLSL